ncbi:hypothetical protein HYS29_02425 [Candidatus Microgenomates bacterium]|nr:hypothetical protein [Candidatus Microgenomates bacterium]
MREGSPIPFERFTQSAKGVLDRAKEEALRLNHNYIGTEHLLAGIARAGEDDLARIALNNLGIELNKVRSAIEFIVGRYPNPMVGEINFTPRAGKVLELAVDEADRLKSPEVKPVHLLLGIVREGEGIAAGVLESLGVNLERVRSEVMRNIYRKGGEEQKQEPHPKPTPQEKFCAYLLEVLNGIPDEGERLRRMAKIKEALEEPLEKPSENSHS